MNAPTRPGRRLSLAALSLGLVLGVVATLAVILVGLWLYRDRTPVLTIQLLEVAERQWLENGPADYDLEVQLFGQREGTIVTQVRGGQIIEHTNNGRVPPQRSWAAWSIPGMLDTLREELTGTQKPDSAGMLRAEFDPSNGCPVKFRRLASGAGGSTNREIGWNITRFEPRPSEANPESAISELPN